ncbi:agarase [Thalassotalea sp. PLHSN55]|uniref:agarase n=1 Tax=Thalassotalea sp. PLHSN55 TaxID=3435888 RepID=UPI003F867ECE
MKKINKLLILSSVALALGCQSESTPPNIDLQTQQVVNQANKTLVNIANFNDSSDNVKLSYVDAQGEVNNGQLNVVFNNQESTYASLTIEPKTHWDWSQFSDFNLAFDIANHGQRSTQIYLDITDGNGDNYTRSVSIPTGGFNTYYAKMKGHDLATPKGEDGVELNFTSGLRSNPDTWQSNEVQFISLWGKKNLDLSSIKRINISVQSALFDKEIQLKNVRLRANPKMDKQFLTNIVDKYGQNAKQDFVGKAHSDEQIQQEKRAEAKLFASQTIADRSKFSGWASGPKFKATGYFRTEKTNGKWSLIDPEGYIYFASGIANIRLSNTSTMTGYDFPKSAIEQQSDNDVTPEDSQGLNRAPNSAVPQRFNASSVRSDMFTWLPEYKETLGKHYGYRRSAHSGPLKKGETFSFYSANLERKYSNDNPDFMQQWQDVTLKRMKNWGFTSLGNWADPEFYDNTQVPYFANGWIRGNYKTVSSGNDFWAPMPDVFDPVFAERADHSAKVVAQEVNNSPWCVGVFIDNEKSFGRPETKESQYGIVLHTLQRDGKTVPTKAEFTRLMKIKYGNISKLNKAWDKNIASWAAFDKGFDSRFNTEQQVSDYSELLTAYADKYFEIVDQAVAKHLPNHMYMGARFPDWGMPLEVVKASAKYVDVVSYNAYKEGLHKKKWGFLEEIDMPAIIGEYHVGAKDSGLFHPGLIHASDQQDRANMFEDYMNSVIDNPYFVGAHWFQYIDSPITGRAYDGENYNVGFVSVTDLPYQPLIESSRKINSSLYQRRYQSK